MVMFTLGCVLRKSAAAVFTKSKLDHTDTDRLPDSLLTPAEAVLAGAAGLLAGADDPDAPEAPPAEGSAEPAEPRADDEVGADEDERADELAEDELDSELELELPDPLVLLLHAAVAVSSTIPVTAQSQADLLRFERIAERLLCRWLELAYGVGERTQRFYS